MTYQDYENDNINYLRKQQFYIIKTKNMTTF